MCPHGSALGTAVYHMKDVTILGGGLAGLSLALQLKQKRPALAVCVLEKAEFPVPEAAHKIGESTVELATHYFAQTLGLEEHLQKEQLPKFGLRFFFGKGDIETRLEVGGSELPPSPSYQLDRGRFENFLSTRCRDLGVEVLQGTTVQDVEVSDSEQPHRIICRSEGRESALQTKWLVDASGRASLLKRRLDLRKSSSHAGSAVWFRVEEEIRLDEWSQKSEWREGHSGRTARWFSTNHLMGAGYWVWLIPLASGSTSIGVVVDERQHPVKALSSVEKTLAWLREHEPQCASHIDPDKIQDFGVLKQYSHDCKRVFSSKRWFVTGEAGVFLDPFYSPGSDFIALSNSFIAELIEAAEEGENIRSKTRFFNNLYLSFFHNTMQIFEGQYALFGHPQIMPLKIVWDQAVYWALLAYLFFQGRHLKPADMAAVGEYVSRIGKANSHMQKAFRKAAETTPELRVSGRIDFLSVQLLLELNRDLGAETDFQDTFQRNAGRLEQLASELLQGMAAQCPDRMEASYCGVSPSHEMTDFFHKIGWVQAAGQVAT